MTERRSLRESWDQLGKAGAGGYVYWAIIVFVLDCIAYDVGHFIDLGVCIAFAAASMALLAFALTEIGFYHLGQKLGSIERKIEDLERMDSALNRLTEELKRLSQSNRPKEAS